MTSELDSKGHASDGPDSGGKSSPSEQPFRSGYVSLTGRPNVGKSTLLNACVGQKISITSAKPQTTRHRIIGVCHADHYQIAFVDTPGLHASSGKALNKTINRVAQSALSDVDVIVMMIEASGWTDRDKHVLKMLDAVTQPVVLVINKIDKLTQREQLLPLMAQCQALYDFVAIVPVCARRTQGIDEFQAVVASHLPVNAAGFGDDDVTDRSMNFLCAEFIREQLFRNLGEEVPYSTVVQTEKMELRQDIQHIDAVIYVETQGQKGIVIGKKGERLKGIATKARLQIEKLVQGKVFLEVRVKVKEGWSDSARALTEFGLSER